MPKDVADNPGSVVAVGTTSTLVAGYNNDRDLLKITNDSDTTIYLRYAESGAVVGSGVRLNANGGSDSIRGDEHIGAVCAIHAGLGTKNLAVVEV